MADCGTVIVEEVFDESKVEISSCEIDGQSSSEVSIEPGGSFEVVATVTNDNDVDADAEVGVYLDGGSPEATDTKTIEPYDDRDFAFDVQIDSKGEYDVKVDLLDRSEA